MGWSPWDIAATVGTGGLYGAAKLGVDAYNKATSPKDDYNPLGIDQSNYYYGGSKAAGAHDYLTQQNMGAALGQRKAPGMDMSHVNQVMGQRNAYTDYLTQAAMGTGGPSAAQMQLQRGNEANMSAASSMAAGARGGGANLAAAQRQAMQQRGAMMAQTGEQAAQLRQQEMMQARGELGGQLANMQQQNYGQALSMGQYQQAQMSMNDQARAAAYQRAMEIQRMRQAGNMGFEAQRSSNYGTAMGENAAGDRQGAQSRADFYQKLIGSVGGAAAMAA